MEYGFVKVAAATPEIRVADAKYNAEQIIRLIRAAESEDVQLLVFPELCVTGYTCGELFSQSVLIEGAKDALKEIVDATAGTKTLVFVGVPYLAHGALYNCAAAISGGRLLALVPKTYLPNYAEFYERRNFVSFDGAMRTVEWEGQTVPFGARVVFRAANQKNFTVSAEICEDLWVPAPPSVSHALAGAHIIVNLSASSETAGKADYRRLLVKAQSAKTVCGYVYADAGEGESTTDLVFSGHDLIVEDGEILAESALFQSGLTVSEIDVDKICFERRRVNTFSDSRAPSDYVEVSFETLTAPAPLTRNISAHPFLPEKNADERAELILSMQAAGLKKRLKHTNSATAVIGISGGLDSSLALLVTVRAFQALGKDPNDIVAVTMPCFGTTDKTLQNSLKLMEALGVTSRTVPVKDAVLQHFKDISHDENNKNAAYENAQARMRTLVLMDIANDANGIVIGTGDLSELALGWATYNGDHMSMYGVNGSIPKTLVKYLVEWVANHKVDDASRLTLLDIVDTPISPELIPADENGNIKQKTEDLVGPYELHDFFLYHFLRFGSHPSKIYFLAQKAFAGIYDNATVKKWLYTFCRRFFQQQFKRSCLPDGPKVGSVSLSPRGDWRMPSDAVSRLWLEEIERINI